MAEKDTVYRFFPDEQLVARPTIPIVVPGATVLVPVTMLTLALAHPEEGAETAGRVAKNSSEAKAHTTTARNFML
ncbi:MAG: hypothetical protein DMF50_05710 [Acidobacteria bacterium]|nr:MAG: hypothetical protein DMF50_05710 [Acidobacteriota bacterium]